MFLDRIEHPSQLMSMNISDLRAIAQEIRDEILETVSANGGHLASSLGVVELTLALLASFEPPRDRIVWDVGHQCYPYKLLTNRRDRFSTLRCGGGISGFPSRFESIYDAFGTGHASTSISAALGYAKARDIRGEDYGVIAVIGDGALTGGIAWEAMNNVGADNTDILVVLNDNDMSISPSVGALATYISQLRSEPLYRSVEEGTRHFLSQLSVGGRLLSKATEAINRGVTHWVSPKRGTLFESLGFKYFGPVDGHDIALLKDLFTRIKKIKGPKLVHVITTKGKGYKYAEMNAQKYHGVGRFNVDSGKLDALGSKSFSKVFGDSMIELAESMPDLVAITAAMPDGTGLSGFAQRFPDRFFNVGIAEEHSVTFAAGLAAGGLKPVVAIYSTFMQRAYDQIVHDVCLQKLPVIFAIDRAGLVGQDGATHHGVFDIAFLRHIPNLVVMSPRNGNELRSMLWLSLTLRQPCAIRYPRDGKIGQITPSFRPLELGKAEVIRDGLDVALIGLGSTVETCLDASVILENEGVSTAVVDARFVKPLDEELILRLATSSGLLVIAEEHVRQCGFGSAILELLNDRGISADNVLSVSLPDEFIPHGDADSSRTQCGCTAVAIADRVMGALRKMSVDDIIASSPEC